MYVNFDDSRFWVDIFRARLQSAGQPVQHRIFTKFMRDSAGLPRDVPSHAKVPLSIIAKLVFAGITVRLGCGE